MAVARSVTGAGCYSDNCDNDCDDGNDGEGGDQRPVALPFCRGLSNYLLLCTVSFARCQVGLLETDDYFHCADDRQQQFLLLDLPPLVSG